MHGHLSKTVPRPAAYHQALPAALDDVIACGMPKNPDRRHATAAGLSVAARGAARRAAAPTDSSRSSRSGRGGAEHRRGSSSVLAIAVVGATLVSGRLLIGSGQARLTVPPLTGKSVAEAERRRSHPR